MARRSSEDQRAYRLNKAQEIFESPATDGVQRAARVIFRERAEAIKNNDSAALAQVGALVVGMRAHLTGGELTEFDAMIEGAKPDRLDVRVARVGDRGPALWITLGVVVLIAIGAFGPWAKALGITVSGTDGSNDGWALFGGAVVAGLCVWAYTVNGSRGWCVLMALAGVGGFAIALHDRRHLTHLSALVQVGWGLNLDLVASAALVVMAAVLAARSRPVTPDTVSESGAAEVPWAVTVGSPETSSDEASRLERLLELRDRGLITDEELAAKRAEILSEI